MENSPAEGGGRVQRSLPSSIFLAPATTREPTTRAVLKVVIAVVASALALYIVYLLRTPLFWLAFAMFVAVVVSAPVRVLERHMRRGLAIALVYLGLILIPVVIGAILIPPAVNAAINLVNDLPTYVDDVDQFIQDNEQLQKLNDNFDLTQKLKELANNAASDLDNAAVTLADLGASLVSSLFALITVLVFSIFMVARGRKWVEALLSMRPQEEAESIERALDRMAYAVSNYVGGALAQATIAAFAAFIVLEILGVPSPLALAVIVGVLDVIPLVGATIGAILVGLITLFTDFPTVTIIWVVFSIAYQQFENYVIQPRIQSKAVELDQFVIVVAAIFGGTLLGVVGALLAIPTAAAVQIGIREYIAYRRKFPVGWREREEIVEELGEVLDEQGEGGSGPAGPGPPGGGGPGGSGDAGAGGGGGGEAGGPEPEPS